MIERLANVLYWGFSGIAILILCFAAYLLVFATNWESAGLENLAFIMGFFAAAAVGSWLIGRACRYVLAGR